LTGVWGRSRWRAPGTWGDVLGRVVVRPIRRPPVKPSFALNFCIWTCDQRSGALDGLDDADVLRDIAREPSISSVAVRCRPGGSVPGSPRRPAPSVGSWPDRRMSRWRAVPGPRGTPIEHETRPPVRSTASPRPRAWAGGRVGFTAEFRGCADSRPRLGGTPVVDEPVAAGCLRNCLWFRSATWLPQRHLGISLKAGWRVAP
jgi:hypothetical protein